MDKIKNNGDGDDYDNSEHFCIDDDGEDGSDGRSTCTVYDSTIMAIMNDMIIVIVKMCY